MKIIFSLLALAAFVVVGCNKNAPPAALPPDKVAPTVQAAFLDANAEVKGIASDLATSVQSKDYPKAFIQLQDLGERKDLTLNQRQAAAQARMLVMQNLVAAAANGDQQAAEILKAYRATK